jgi:hypothetical protein
MSFHDLRRFRDGDGRAVADLRRLARRDADQERSGDAGAAADPLERSAGGARSPPSRGTPSAADGGRRRRRTATAGARSFRNAIGGKTISAYRFG